MKDKITALKVSLRILLARIEAIKTEGEVNYEVEQKVDELSKKVFEMADILEGIEAPPLAPPLRGGEN